jgi:hypothetical protein
MQKIAQVQDILSFFLGQADEYLSLYLSEKVNFISFFANKIILKLVHIKSFDFNLFLSHYLINILRLINQ